MFKHSKSDSVDFAKIYDLAERVVSKKKLAELPVVKKIVEAKEEKKKKKRLMVFMKYANFSMAGLFLAVLAYSGFYLMKAQDIYTFSIQGKNEMEKAVAAMKSHDFESAASASESARDNFNRALEALSGYNGNFFIENSVYLESQISSFKHLLSALGILAQAASEASKFGADLNSVLRYRDFSFAGLSDGEKEEVLKFIYEKTPELYGIKANIDLAWMNMEKISFEGPLKAIEREIADAREKLNNARILISKSLPLAELLPSIMGYPGKSSYLLILQNQDELRPTGGFIGTYGIMETENGNFIRVDTHDIYHMDMPVKDKVNVPPPAPIKKYLVDKWYMRDANWSPDWPESARQIEWFYHKEDALLPPKDRINDFDGEFDGVIAVTPDFITSLLALTGPIRLGDDEFNKDNFVQLLEYKVEKEYVQLGIPSWHRKEVIGDIVAELKKRLLDDFQVSINDTFNVLTDNLAKKNIIVYSKDPHLQKVLEEKNWAGNIISAESDYFYVVDSNMASYKSDAVVNRRIEYALDEGAGGIFSRLTVNYSHTGGFDWRTTRYRTYTRFYLPLGSELVEASGYTDGKVDIYEEYGKTVLGMFISVEPGQIGSLRVKYKLPPGLVEKAKNGSYGLYVQKQPGRKVEELKVDLKFINDIKLYNPSGFFAEKEGENRIVWEDGLLTDKLYNAEF